MFALMHDAKVYSYYAGTISGSTERAERTLASERGFIGDAWGGGIYLISCGDDMLVA